MFHKPKSKFRFSPYSCLDNVIFLLLRLIIFGLTTPMDKVTVRGISLLLFFIAEINLVFLKSIKSTLHSLPRLNRSLSQP